MNQEHFLVGVLIEETTSCSFSEVCRRYNIPQELLVEMVEHGLFFNQSTQLDKLTLNQKELRRIESAFRLHQDLGVNLPGVALALELLEKIDRMDEELNILRKHF